jgi:hypothetical protein
LSFVEWDIRIGTEAILVDRRLARLTRRGWTRTHARSAAAWQAAVGEARWEPLLAVLTALVEPEDATHARARIVLSNGLVRYAVLPWNAALTGPEQDQIFLAHRFRQLYGEGAAVWQMRCEYASAGRARLASAVDAGLIDAIQGVLGRRGITLQSVVPALAKTVNRHRAQLDRSSAWLVCHEDGWLCMARWHQWEWMAVRSLRVDAGWRNALPALLAREECLHDAPEEVSTVYLDAADGPPVTMPGWAVLPLRTPEAALP